MLTAAHIPQASHLSSSAVPDPLSFKRIFELGDSMTEVEDAQNRANRVAIRDERAKDAARALQEVQTERKAALAKTARLRALRLAQQTDSPRKRKHPK